MNHVWNTYCTVHKRKDLYVKIIICPLRDGDACYTCHLTEHATNRKNNCVKKIPHLQSNTDTLLHLIEAYHWIIGELFTLGRYFPDKIGVTVLWHTHHARPVRRQVCIAQL